MIHALLLSAGIYRTDLGDLSQSDETSFENGRESIVFIDEYKDVCEMIDDRDI